MSNDHANERWLPVVGFEKNYEVSSLGRVRRTNYRLSYSGKMMTLTPN